MVEFEFRDGKVRVTTDYAEMPVFVYPEDRFASAEELVAEIEKKIVFEESKKLKSKKDKLYSDLKVKGFKEKDKDA